MRIPRDQWLSAARVADMSWENNASAMAVSRDREFVGAAQEAQDIARAIRALALDAGATGGEA